MPSQRTFAGSMFTVASALSIRITVQRGLSAATSARHSGGLAVRPENSCEAAPPEGKRGGYSGNG